ncbi:MAG: Ig-like domain-containing protein [Planctomycetota bacterium]
METHRRIHHGLQVEELEYRLAPGIVSILMDPGSDSGVLNYDQLTNETMPLYWLIIDDVGTVDVDFDGDGEHDAEESIYWDMDVAPGIYPIIPTVPLADGYWTVTVTFYDLLGIPEDIDWSPTWIDTTAPDAPPPYGGNPSLPSLDLWDGTPDSVLNPLGSDSGLFGDDNVTYVTTPTFNVARMSNDLFYRIYRNALGDLEPTLVSSDSDGMGFIGDDGVIYRPYAIEDPFTGAITIVPAMETLTTQPESAVGNPWYYTLRAVDWAGNESPDGPGIHVYLDATGPDLGGGQAIIDLMSESDSGIFNDDDYTNDYTPSFEVSNIAATPGSEDFGLFFRIFRDGVEISHTPIVGDDFHIYKELDPPPEFPWPPIGPGEPTTIGHETLLDQQTPFATPSENVYVYTVQAVDLAGNLSDPGQSDPLTVTIDTLAPQAPTLVDLHFGSDSGAWDDDNYTNITRPRFDVTVNDETQDYWQLWRELWLDPSSSVRVSTGDYVGADGHIYRGSGDPFSPPWAPGSGYEVLTDAQPDSVDEFGRPIPYLYSALAIDIAGNPSDLLSLDLPVIIDTAPPPVMTLGDPRPAEPLPDTPLNYIPGQTEPIHTNWPTFEWPYAMIPAGPFGGGNFDPTKQDCYLTTYWIKMDGGTGPEFEYDTRYGSNWNPAGYGPRPFGDPLPPMPQDDPGTNFAAPDIVYTLPTGGPEPWRLNRGLTYGFHTWQIRAEDLAGNMNDYSNAMTFLIDTHTDADGDIIRLDVDRATLRNAGMDPTLTVLPNFVPPGGGVRPGTGDIASIDIAHTYDGSVLHFYIDPNNPNEPGIGPGDGRFTVGDVRSPANVALGILSIGIPKDWTPSNPGTFEGIGTFRTVAIGGNRLGALIISGDYDASAGQSVTVGGGLGELGLFRAENITLNAPGGHSAILAADTRFVLAPHGNFWDAPGVPLAPIAVQGLLWMVDDSGARLAVGARGGVGQVTLVPMANGIGSVVAEIYLPTPGMTALARSSEGGDVSYVESAGGGIMNVMVLGGVEMDLFAVNSNGGSIQQVSNNTYGGDIFHIDAGAGNIVGIFTYDTGRLGAIYSGGPQSARRVFARHDPWPAPQDPPVHVPIGLGEDYFTANGIVAANVQQIRAGELNGADVQLSGVLSGLTTMHGVIDTDITATAIMNIMTRDSVKNSSFVTTLGNLTSFLAYDTILNSTISAAGQFFRLLAFNGLTNSTIEADSVQMIRVIGPVRGTTLDVTNGVSLINLGYLLGGSNFSIGGNLGRFYASADVRDSILDVGGSITSGVQIMGAIRDSEVKAGGGVSRIDVFKGITDTLVDVGGNLGGLTVQSGASTNNVIHIGGNVTIASVGGGMADSLFAIDGSLQTALMRGVIGNTQLVIGGNLVTGLFSGSIIGSRIEVGGNVQRFMCYNAYTDTSMAVGMDLQLLSLMKGITGGTVAQPNLLNVGGNFVMAQIGGDISANTKISVGGLPPAGQESDLVTMNVLGLIYGDIEVYGDILTLRNAGTAPTPTGPREGFTEAYLLNDRLGEPTGGRLDIGGRAMRLL